MSDIVLESFKTILLSYLVLVVWQVVFWPTVNRIFINLPDRGWSITRMFGILVISFVVWTLSTFGFQMNTQKGVLVLIGFFVLVGIFVKVRNSTTKITKRALKTIVMSEYLFLAVFFLISFVRGYQPQLDSLEKFMDYGFINSYLNSPVLPATDMWQAGRSINYYSFGQFWASILIRTLGVSPSVGYNLLIGYIGGSVASITVVLVSSLTKKSKGSSLVGGLLASVLMVFGGNGYTIWYFIKNGSFENFWYADATRFIYNTIHEFPSYSLIVSDLHGHLLDLPVVLFFLLILFNKKRERRLVDMLMLGFLFGIMMMSNTWDVLVFGLLTGVYYLGQIYAKKISFKTAFLDAVVVCAALLATAYVWWKNFQSISSGIRLVETRSPIWQLGVLWSLTLVVAVMAWIFAKKHKTTVVRSIVVVILLLILIPEVIYFKDIYPDHPRANTMFKLTYQAFVLGTVIFGVVATNVTEKLRFKFSKVFSLVTVIFIFCSSVSFSALAYPSFYGNLTEYKGLDGESWLSNESEPLYEMLRYLRENRGKGSIVEAVGDSYTHKNILSAYTGIPTIQGWRVHEWLWRGGYDSVALREKEVREIYEGKDLSETKDLLYKYGVEYIVVGPNEEEMYLVNHKKITSLGKVINFGEEYYLVLIL